MCCCLVSWSVVCVLLSDCFGLFLVSSCCTEFSLRVVCCLVSLVVVVLHCFIYVFCLVLFIACCFVFFVG